jgi:hypothetical protein
MNAAIADRLAVESRHADVAREVADTSRALLRETSPAWNPPSS